MGHLGSSYYPHSLLLSPLIRTVASHLRPVPSCLGLSSLWLFSPNTMKTLPWGKYPLVEMIDAM
jgi:hypothetical protein